MGDLELYFKYRCGKGLANRGLVGKQKYEERLKNEIQVITEMGYCGYFLIVADIITWALRAGIPVGPGRGSAAGSLVSYVLEITHLDPIQYGLIFERFLNPARVSMPDIDMDFCEERRGEVIQYVENRYGKDQVAHIGTFGSMKAKAAIRDVTRVQGFSYDLGDKLAKLTLEPIDGKAQSLATCYEKVPELKSIRNGNPSEAKDILVWAEKVENRIRSFGTHASGIVISADPIAQVIPLYPGKEEMATTQFEMNTVEECGLIKFDILGLRALTTIDRCVKMVKQRHNKYIDILHIPVNDKKVYQLLQSGDVFGIFQLEGSTGIRDLLVQIRPTNLEDIAVLVAIYRPGPLGSDMLSHYLKVRAEEASAHFTCPELEPILGPTDGMLIYQEQILEICKQLAGYTLAQADLMRRAIGKKKEKEMGAQEAKLIEGMLKNGINLDDAKKIWEDIKVFAAYGFNRSHAICYGLISYQMAYLKTYYPLEFMCSCLISDSDETDKVIQYISYCQSHGVKVIGPSINESDYSFTVTKDNKSIRFGLSAIKNLGKPVKEIINEREKNGPYKSLLDFAERVDLSKINSRKIESLVLTGAFDDLGPYTRSSLLAGIEEISRYKEEMKRFTAKLSTFQKRMEAYKQRQIELANWEIMSKEDRQASNRKRPGLVKLPEKPELPISPQIPDRPEMPSLILLGYEKELMGYYVSGHPLDNIYEKSHYTIAKIKESGRSKQKVQLIAIPSMIKETTTKKSKQKMAYVDLEDKTGTISSVILPKPFAQYKELIDIQTPARYDVEIEITEGDMGKVTKLIITNVTALHSIQEFRNRPVEAIVSLDSAIAAARRVTELQGKTSKVQLCLQSDEGNMWKLGIFGCSSDRTNLEKIMKDYK